MRVWCGQSPTAMRFLGNSLSRFLGRISCAVYLGHSLVLASLGAPIYLARLRRLGHVASISVATLGVIAASLWPIASGGG
jgi:peptidoglycan/LPS O-acetylase OafA/YrhL